MNRQFDRHVTITRISRTEFSVWEFEADRSKVKTTGEPKSDLCLEVLMQNLPITRVTDVASVRKHQSIHHDEYQWVMTPISVLVGINDGTSMMFYLDGMTSDSDWVELHDFIFNE